MKHMTAYCFNQVPDIELTNSICLLNTGAFHCLTNDHTNCIVIRKCKDSEVLVAETNGGLTCFDHVEECCMLPVSMYYNPNTAATIVAFHEIAVIPNGTIKYDSAKENAFFVIFTIQAELSSLKNVEWACTIMMKRTRLTTNIM